MIRTNNKLRASVAFLVPLVSASFGAGPVAAADTVLKAPVSAGITLTVVHGYNDPLPTARCVIGAAADHCGNQQYGGSDPNLADFLRSGLR